LRRIAWVSERKDVLSTFFWILTMWLYIRYVRRPHFAAYLLDKQANSYRLPANAAFDITQG